MNDRFKFRVFSKDTKELLFVLTLGGYFIKATPSLVVTSCRTLKADNCILEQSTGLKDKNGRLIYEGDIVNILCEIEEQGVIEWAREEAQFVIRAERAGFVADFDNYNGIDLEVIGNIHENPELLEAGK